MPITMSKTRSLPDGRPGLADVGDEQEPALIEEREMRASACCVFLAGAIPPASTWRWRLRRARGRAVPAFANSSHPGLRSEVLDLPQAVEHGRKLAREAGIDDVVTHRAGNALVDSLGCDYDVILLANVAHHFSPDQNLDLARRAKAALTTGGTFAIWETEQPGQDAEADIVGDAFALFFRVMSTSRTYQVEEYVGWFEAAGYVDTRALRPPMGPGMVLVTGRKPE